MRGLLSSKGFTAVAVLTLGLGIGVNTAIFTVVNALLFRPLPVEQPEQLVVVASQTELVESPIGISYPNYLDYRERHDVLQDLVVYAPQPVSLRDEGSAVRAWVEMVSGNYFDMLGVNAVHGRTFNDEEGRVVGGAPVMVLDYGYWQREYGGDPDIIGHTVQLNGNPFTIIGVAPQEFPGTEFMIAVDAYVSIMMLDQVSPDLTGALESRGGAFFRSMGRMQPDVTAEQASASLNALADDLEREYPDDNRGIDLIVVPETMARPEPATAGMMPAIAAIFMGLVGLVLLITCANIANLLIARASTRHKEIAIRGALGAGRFRIIRQLIIESTVLGVLGGVVGIVLGIWASNYLASGVDDFPVDIPIRFDLSPDYRVFLFAFGLAVVTGVIAGGLPALRVSRTSLVDALKEGGRNADGSGGGQRLRDALVVAQVAVSLVLLVAAGLFVRSLQNARGLDIGFRIENTLMMSIDPALLGYDEDGGRQLYREVSEQLGALPGVVAASPAGFVPFGGRAGIIRVALEGRPASEDSDTFAAFYNEVGPDYFRAAGTTVLRGRGFSAADSVEAPPVTLVNESMAEALWPSEEPIGKRISLRNAEGPWIEVIGITVDTKLLFIWEDNRPVFYMPLEQQYSSPATFFRHTDVEPASLAAAVRAEVATIDPDLPVYDINTMQSHLEDGTALGIVSVAAVMVGSFGVVGLLLASIGLYGVIAYSVSRRTHEIGVRLALGAASGSVLKMVVRQGMTLAGIGLGVGLVLALLLSRALSTMLLDVSATDVVTYAAVTAFLLVVALFASYLPARRATSVDPLVALRDE